MMGRNFSIDPILPTTFVCRDGAFESAFATPIIDFGERNDGWHGGGAMTHAPHLTMPRNTGPCGPNPLPL